MLGQQIVRLLEAYPAIYLACHRRHIRDDERGHVVTDSQASVLAHLHATRPVTLSTIARHLGIGRSAMSIAIAKLVRTGYVRRERAEKDGRAIHLTLTAAGVRITEQNTVLDKDLVREQIGRDAFDDGACRRLPSRRLSQSGLRPKPPPTSRAV
jgi:DNA-binding MarR family transcriptional regulator